MRLEIQQVLYFITPFFSLLGTILSLTLHLVYSSLSGSGSTQLSSIIILAPAVAHEHMVLCSTIQTSLEIKLR